VSTPKKPRVLIVDDDPIFRRLLERHYTTAGWEAAPASGIATGLAACAKAPCDLVVVDYLQLMSGAYDSENRQQEISDISRSLKSVAKELSEAAIELKLLIEQMREQIQNIE